MRCKAVSPSPDAHKCALSLAAFITTWRAGLARRTPKHQYRLFLVFHWIYGRKIPRLYSVTLSPDFFLAFISGVEQKPFNGKYRRTAIFSYAQNDVPPILIVHIIGKSTDRGRDLPKCLRWVYAPLLNSSREDSMVRACKRSATLIVIWVMEANMRRKSVYTVWGESGAYGRARRGGREADRPGLLAPPIFRGAGDDAVTTCLSIIYSRKIAGQIRFFSRIRYGKAVRCTAALRIMGTTSDRNLFSASFKR